MSNKLNKNISEEEQLAAFLESSMLEEFDTKEMCLSEEDAIQVNSALPECDEPSDSCSDAIITCCKINYCCEFPAPKPSKTPRQHKKKTNKYDFLNDEKSQEVLRVSRNAMSLFSDKEED